MTTKEEFGVGFKNYDELVFGNNQTDLSPFTQETWDLVMKWYRVIAAIIGGPILLAIVILSWKMIVAGISPEKRNEVKDNIMRLFFGAVSIVFAPIFVKFMLLLNNSLVRLLDSNTHGSLDNLLGNSILTNINTGNAIATAIVIAMFAYLFVKINIKFIIREFTLIVFTIFTPIVAVFWIINKKTIASSIWFGQIIINAFIQFIFTFLFLIYMTFLPESAEWATSLLWAMMILPLSDALLNTMQNLVSRIAGINNEEMANRGIGLGAAMGYTVGSIAYQLKGSNNESLSSSISNNSNERGSDIIGKVINKATESTLTEIPGKNLENNSTNVMDNAKAINQKNIMEQTDSSNKLNQNTNISDNSNNLMKNNTQISENAIEENQDNNTGSEIKKIYNVGKEFMNLGMYMAEGRNYRNNINSRSGRKEDRRTNRPNVNNTRKEDFEKNDENTNNVISIELDDENEL